MAAPLFTPAEARTRGAFLAMLNALSRPGAVIEFPQHPGPVPEGMDALADAFGQWGTARNFIAAGETLLDLETTFYTPNEALRTELARTSARPAALEDAEYIFLPRADSVPLEALERARIGTMLYPDRSATLIAGCVLGRGQSLRLSGPGVPGSRELAADGVPAGFWELRNRKRRYPMGWDVLLMDARSVAGVPRSAGLEILGGGI